MLRKPIVLLGLALPALLLQTATAAEPLPPAARWMPADAVLVLEVSRPAAVLDLALHPKVLAEVSSFPAFKKQTANPDFQQILQLLEHLEQRFDTDWKTGLGKLLGGGVTLAIGPGDHTLLIVDSEDTEMLEQLHEIFLTIARGEAAKRGEPDVVASAEYRGVTGWTFNGKEAHAIVGNRLLVANKAEALRTALDLRAEPSGRSLASLPAYQSAKRAAGPDAPGLALANLEVLKLLPGVQNALAPSENPLLALLFAGVTEALRESSWLAMDLNVEGETLSLEAMVDGKAADPSGAAAFAWPSEPGEGALPNLSVPRRIAGLSFYRDLHSFYAAKDELFPERTSGLIFFENMMGIFFSGRDLTEEVLGEMKPEVRVVVAEQEYDPAVGTPRVQIPAFAAIFRLQDPEAFSEVAEEAWQKAVGLINFTRGQQALPGLIIDRPIHGGTKFTLAYFSSPAEDEEEKGKTELESRYNFRPALAMLGDYLVLSSTDGLARDLIDALKKEMEGNVKALAETHSLVEVDGVQLASILRANRENLVLQNMVNDGNTREQAETQNDLIVTILKYLGQAKLNVKSHNGRSQARLDLKPNLK